MTNQLELKQVAELAGVTPSRIRHLLGSDAMPAPAGKVGQTWVWDDDEALRTWLATPRPSGRRRTSRSKPATEQTES
jgi:hypothetical protein